MAIPIWYRQHKNYFTPELILRSLQIFVLAVSLAVGTLGSPLPQEGGFNQQQLILAGQAVQALLPGIFQSGTAAAGTGARAAAGAVR